MTIKADKENAHRELEGAPKIGQVFRHYKGGLYVVTEVSIMEDSLEPLVTYRSNARGTSWTRTLANFTQWVSPGNATVPAMIPRFRRETD